MQPSTASSIDSFIRLEVAQVIRERCQCDFQESFISQAVLLCDQQQPTQIVYRAKITSYGSYSSNQLLGYIEDWVKQGATFNTVSFVVIFDPKCPVRINDISDPVCSQTRFVATIPASSSAVTPTSTQCTPNVLVAIAAGVSVFVIIVAATIIVIIILIIYLLSQKKKK